MSIAFQAATPSAPPPLEHVVWRVRKGDRLAEARVRLMAHGRELRVLVGPDIAWSRLFRDHEDSRALGVMADGCLADFERLGWQRDAAVPPVATA